MVEKLESFDFGPGGGSKRIYDWKKWCDGGIYKLVEGKDYTCKRKSMVNHIHLQAKTRQLYARTCVKEKGTIVFQMTKSPRE